MKRQFFFLATTFILFASTGCSKGMTANDVNNSIHDNQAAQNQNEWDASPNNPDNLFKKWHESHTSANDICKALEDKSPADLTIFEEQLKDPKNSDLVSPCKDDLLAKISNYWSTHSTTNVPLDFQFPDNVQYRSTKGGYVAINGDVGQKEIVLSFDDGPHPQYTDQILQILRSVNAKAMFFHVGKMAQASPDVVRRVGSEGHTVGSHSMTHLCLAATANCARINEPTLHVARDLTFAEATNEIMSGEKAVFDALGWIEPFFRFPYGEYDVNLKNYLNSNNMGEFFWMMDSDDWKQQDPSQVIANAMAQINAKGKGIILFHDIQHRTVILLPEFLRQLYYGGYSLVLLKSDSKITSWPPPNAPLPIN